MNKQTFKAGDKVYHPLISRNICVLTNVDDQRRNLLVIKEGDDITIFDKYGCEYLGFYRDRSIFHATEENCELLSKLYGIEFEKPKPRPTARQVIEHRLAKASFAPCLVGDRYHWDAMALIVCVKDDKDGNVQYIDGVGNVWHDAQLIDDNENEITEIEE